MTDLDAPDRELIGGTVSEKDVAAAGGLVDLYANGGPRSRTLTTNLWSSGLARLVATAMLAQRGNSTDSISQLCVKAGADVPKVLEATGMDPQCGPGTASEARASGISPTSSSSPKARS